MARRERPRRPLAVDPDLLALAVDLMLFELGDVVADVIDQVHLQFLPRPAEDAREHFAGLLHEELAVAPGEVGGRPHRRQVMRAFGTLNRRTG